MSYYDDEPTRMSNNAGPGHTGAYDYDAYSTSHQVLMPEPPRRRPRWLIPVASAFTVALLGGGIAAAAMLGHSDPSSSTAPSSVAVAPPATTSSAQTTPSEGTTAPPTETSSEAPSEEASATEQPTDDFPMDVGTGCRTDGVLSQVSEADVRTGTDSSTCAFVSNARQEVLDAISGGAGGTFEVRPYSAFLGDVVPLNCSRTNHLTHCTGGTNVDIWVQDSDN